MRWQAVVHHETGVLVVHPARDDATFTNDLLMEHYRQGVYIGWEIDQGEYTGRTVQVPAARVLRVVIYRGVDPPDHQEA